MVTVFILYFIICISFNKVCMGNTSNGIVKRGKFTRDTCAKACDSETTIKCKFFNFDKQSGKCYLSSTIHLNMQVSGRSRDKSAGAAIDVTTETKDYNKLYKGMSEGTQRKLEALQSKVNQLREDIEDFDEIRQKVSEMRLEAEKASKTKSQIIDELQNSKVQQEMEMNKLNRKVESLILNMEKTMADVAAFKKTQFNFEKKQSQIKHMLSDLTAQIENIQDKTSVIPVELKNVKIESDNLSKGLAEINMRDKTLQHNLETIKQEVLYARQKLEPEIKAVRKTQESLIEDLTHIRSNSDVHNKQYSELQMNVRQIAEDATEAISSMKTLKSQTVNNLQLIKNIKLELNKLKDPESRINLKIEAERKETRQDIDMLKTQLKEEHTRSLNTANEMEKIIKSLSSVTMMQNDIKAQLEEMSLKVSDLQNDISTLKISQGPISKIKEIENKQELLQTMLNSAMKQIEENKNNQLLFSASQTPNLQRDVVDKLAMRINELETSFGEMKNNQKNMKLGLHLKTRVIHKPQAKKGKYQHKKVEIKHTSWQAPPPRNEGN
ncbi:myosin-9 isoform X1 [Octopus bimaculoides]|uniref:myosin-9 isoform X1 n=1 Tax=Octopus bimaculoides TaxID=37653 RepID=UPI00071DB80A|nr:myosin-9 isoform X1 [Octopus bimaculoides]|eukprot:XP_014786820.1 PREDICTED: myosin-9-like isoform X1 [Octopus bimaculoides]